MVENLNLMTRRELTSAQGLMTASSLGGKAIGTLLETQPETRGIRPELDVFEVMFAPESIEDISFAVEQYSFAIAERYAVKLEDGRQNSNDDDQHFFWQALHEKWAYLEIMSG